MVVIVAGLAEMLYFVHCSYLCRR